MLFAPNRRAASNARSTSVVDDDALKAGADVGDLLLRQRRGSLLLPLAHEAQHRGLEPAEAEIEIAFEMRRIAVGVREAGTGQAHRAIVTAASQPIDHRSAGITEPEQLGDFVVRLTRRIVAGATQQLVVARLFDQIETG